MIPSIAKSFRRIVPADTITVGGVKLKLSMATSSTCDLVAAGAGAGAAAAGAIAVGGAGGAVQQCDRGRGEAG